MCLTGAFMVVEAAGGLISGSLALLADAGHMLTDTAALALSWFAFRMARRPATEHKSYGYHRFQILAAFANGLALFAIALWIVVEAVGRLWHPVEILGMPMIAIAAMGLVVNCLGFWILNRGEGHGHNLNIRSASLHILGDLLGSVAAIAAAAIILYTGWTPIDPILSVLVALMILRGAWAVVKQSSHILLEGTPEGLDSAAICQALETIPGVAGIHHVHAWSLTSDKLVVTLHAVVTDAAQPGQVVRDINAILQERFGVGHATVQIEHGGEPCGADADGCGP